MILSCSSLSKVYNGEAILKDVSFKIEENEKLAVIGVNGAGKTTLLRLITGEITPDSGDISMNKSMSIGYLSQNHIFDDHETIYHTLEKPFSSLIKIEKRMRELEELMAQNNDLEKVMNEYERLSYHYETEGGYEISSRIRGILTGLGFEENMWDKPVSILSGGQKARIALGQLLLKEPDLLLLDEPTNHLDLYSIEWLENYIKNYRKAVIVVCHDRYFINETTSSILEIENGKSHLYKCHYEEYASLKKHEREIEMKHYLNNQKEIKRMQESIKTLKSYNREKQVRRAESKEKALAKMEKIDRPDALPEPIRIQFQPELESGFDVLRVKDVSMSFDSLLFEHISFEIKKGERVALLGINGIGKTTLFRIILNELTPDSGSVQLGVKVICGHYDQEQSSLTLSKTVFEEIHDAYPLMTQTEIRNFCASFLFKGDDVFKTIDQLSGGERGRVVLMKLLLKKSNFLLLDEPTNHLDIMSKEVLEDALLDFEGTIFFISHDRYFINKMASKTIELTKDNATVRDGNYTDYTNRIITPMKKEKTPQKKSHKNLMKRLENDINDLEALLTQKQDLLLDEDIINDYQKYNSISDEISLLEEELENKLIELENLS